MEFFEKAKTVRLKGHHGKYLWAEEDRYRITQNRESKNEQALWRVEKVPESNLVRLISCYETYLTASDDIFLLGMTGKKVTQTRVKHVDSSIEWEPISERFLVKLKTCHGNFLRANNGVPPWRNSVTHDLPQRFNKHQEFLFWEVETVTVPNVIPVETPSVEILQPPQRESHHAWVPHGLPSPRVSSHPKADEGREIFYTVANEKGEAKNVDDEGWSSFKFKGHSLKVLKERLQKETGIEDDIILCARHPMSTKLYTLRLALPPNNAAMHIVVVMSSSPLVRVLSHTPSV